MEETVASDRFDRSIYFQGKHFIEEIAGLDDVFEFLDAWPEERRGFAYEALLKACRDAARKRFPLSAVREIVRGFVDAAGILVEVDDVRTFEFPSDDRNVSGP
jgi:Protein of unknown function (DUF982)